MDLTLLMKSDDFQICHYFLFELKILLLDHYVSLGMEMVLSQIHLCHKLSYLKDV